MRKTGFIVISALVIFGVTIVSCSLPLIPLTDVETPPTSSFSPIPVIVSPFYDSSSHQINVGDYSEKLGTFNFEELSTLVEVMAAKKEELTPEQMFVLAIRLFELGDNDNSVYWFYEAQFRAKLFLIALDPEHIGGIGEPSFELPTAYNAFTQLSTEYINGYAGCDIDNWVNITTKVRNDNPNPPDLDKLFPGVVFVERSRWPLLNQEVAEGLDGLINYLSNNKEAIQQQRIQNNADNRYCSQLIIE